MSVTRAAPLLLLLAALAVPAGVRVPCAGEAPPADCRCPGGDDGAPAADGCGPSGCCCAREGAPAAPAEPSTATRPGPKELAGAPAPATPAVPAAAAGAASFAPAAQTMEASTPSLFLVLCTFRC